MFCKKYVITTNRIEVIKMEDIKSYSTPNGTIFKVDIFKGKRVLIGDYSSCSYYNTKMVLDSLGIEYVIENAPFPIYERIRRGEKFDAIFTNNIYTYGTGEQLLGLLHTLKDFNIPVVIHTISDNVNNQFLNMGFNGYLKKPITQEDTIKVLSELGFKTTKDIQT